MRNKFLITSDSEPLFCVYPVLLLDVTQCFLITFTEMFNRVKFEHLKISRS
jgi:hypothetical protein